MSLLMQEDLRRSAVERIKSCGYLYVALDSAGYRSGSLNEAIPLELVSRNS